MKTLKITFSLVAFSFMLVANAQIDSFKLANYKLPYVKRKMLEMSFNLAGDNDWSKMERKSSSNVNKANDFNLGGNIDLNYSDFFNQEKRQGQSQINLFLSPNFRKYKSKGSGYTPKIKDKNLSSSFYLNRKDRFYFKPKLFFELAPMVHYTFLGKKDYEENIAPSTGTNRDEISKTHQAKAELGLRLGKGRITQVQDARHALYIVETLQKQNRLKSGKTNEQITELADKIAEILNQRFFDGRLRHIAEIEEIDSFLQVNNYVNKTDARYFSSLNDIWSFGNIHRRLNGKRISAAIVPAYRFSSYKKSEDNTTTETLKARGFSLDLGLNFDYHKPVDLYWQHDFNAALYAGFLKGKQTRGVENDDNDLEIPKIQFGLDHNLSYFPNTRTMLKLGYKIKFIKTFAGEDLGSKIMVDATAFNMFGYFQAKYYVSPRFRINFSASLGSNTIDGNSSLSYVYLRDNFLNVLYPEIRNLGVKQDFKITHFVAEFSLKLTYAIF